MGGGSSTAACYGTNDRNSHTTSRDAIGYMGYHGQPGFMAHRHPELARLQRRRRAHNKNKIRSKKSGP